MNDATLLGERPLLGFPGTSIRLFVDGRNYSVEIHDPVGCEVWKPATKADAASMYIHPFCHGYNYRAERPDYDEDAA
jgi:hypothetical protein